jgi:hypothetical protein
MHAPPDNRRGIFFLKDLIIEFTLIHKISPSPSLLKKGINPPFFSSANPLMCGEKGRAGGIS